MEAGEHPRVGVVTLSNLKSFLNKKKLARKLMKTCGKKGLQYKIFDVEKRAQPGIEPGTSSNSGTPEEGIILLDH
jgi:hypothetical protein